MREDNFKELLGNSLSKTCQVSISPNRIIINMEYLKSFNLDLKDDYGVLEVGMDKGEIDYLTKIVRQT